MSWCLSMFKGKVSPACPFQANHPCTWIEPINVPFVFFPVLTAFHDKNVSLFFRSVTLHLPPLHGCQWSVHFVQWRDISGMCHGQRTTQRDGDLPQHGYPQSAIQVLYPHRALHPGHLRGHRQVGVGSLTCMRLAVVWCGVVWEFVLACMRLVVVWCGVGSCLGMHAIRGGVVLCGKLKMWFPEVEVGVIRCGIMNGFGAFVCMCVWVHVCVYVYERGVFMCVC